MIRKRQAFQRNCNHPPSTFTDTTQNPETNENTNLAEVLYKI